jgi:hypothetical protein
VAFDCIALDKGPGMHDIAACLGDGFSTAGSAGGGLGAVLRMADLADIYSRPGSGTVIFVRFELGSPDRPRNAAGNALLAALFNRGRQSAAGEGERWGGISVAKAGETACGDNWQVRRRDDGLMAMVADGLGHGMLAAEAANVAVNLFERYYDRRPAEIINLLHAGLRHTRGAAIGVMHLDRAHRAVHFAGIGNIAATLVTPGGSRRMISHNGTVGHVMARVQEIDYPFDASATVVMHSDGIGSGCSLAPYAGLEQQHPMTIAATLYRDFQRGRDDATVLVSQVD